MSRNTHDRLLDHHGTDTTANIVLASATQTYTAGLTVQSVLADLDGRIIGSPASWKGPCVVATTANVNLSTGLVNGTVIDGVTLATGNRVLVRAQTTASENGIYVVPASGAASRSSDADTGSKLEGAIVVVQRGTIYADTIWLQTADNVVIDVTTINWVQVQARPGTSTTSSAPGDTTSHGTSDTYARSDHRHGREQHGTSQHSAGTVVPTAAAGSSAPGDTAAEGTATTLARSDHRHSREAYATTAEIADVAATEAAGTLSTVARGDHVHALGIGTTKGDLLARSSSAWARLPVGADGQVLTADSTEALGVRWVTSGAGQAGNVGAIFDGGGAAISGTPEVDIQVPAAGTITGWTILADVTGSATIDVRRTTYAGYPPTPSDSIVGSSPPTLASGVKAQGSPTGWSTSLAAGDILRFRVTSASTVTRLAVILSYTRS